MIFTHRPIDSWNRPETKHRGYSPFKAAYSSTLTLLDRELGMLNAKNVVLQVDVTERDCRLDGQLRANARPASPKIVLAFDSKHGPLKYYCDRWADWQANLRGIALGLEAQRKLERYGITSRGEQYTGWKALGAGIEMGPAAMTSDEAAEFLSEQTFIDDIPEHVEDIALNAEYRARIYRDAAKRLHPDAGGDTATFQKLQDAKRILDEADA